MKITVNTLRQLIKEALSEALSDQKPIPSYDGANPQNLFREIIRDYDIFVTKEDIHNYGSDGIAETMDGKYKMEYGLRTRSGDTWFEFTGSGADEWFNAGSGGHSYEWQRETIDKVLKYLEPYKKPNYVNEGQADNAPSIPFELVGASPKEIASYIQKNYIMYPEQDNSGDYLVLVTPEESRRLVAVDKYLYLTYDNKKSAVIKKILVDLTKSSNEVIEKRINKILQLLEPFKK